MKSISKAQTTSKMSKETFFEEIPIPSPNLQNHELILRATRRPALCLVFRYSRRHG